MPLEEQRGKRGTDPPILKLGARWGGGGS